MKDYSPRETEEKWQKVWEKDAIFQTDEDSNKPKYYALEQFPYPSGEGLHMGHMRVYSIGDVVARFRRMNGYRVLHPMGADAFGLPAENAAIKRGVLPGEWTIKNMDRFVQEQSLMGVSYDWDRYVATCLPDYYQFTQWLFLLFYERGLAYRKKAFVNWCPTCSTVLANEQVEDGKCWRCSSEVTKKELEQWFLKITDYAEELLVGLDHLPKWPEKVKAKQKNWIGKSRGSIVTFSLANKGLDPISVFTTRPDTLYGVPYLVLSPEHTLVKELIKGKSNEQQLQDFIHHLVKQPEMERTSTDSEKLGYFTGEYATHPLTGNRIPIWIANYVLMDVGTGAVMGVPAHDERDFQFAKKYQLPIQYVIQPFDEEEYDERKGAFVGEGKLIHSQSFNGLPNREAIRKISDALAEKDKGGPTVTYRLRDWLISRQRYWGTPIPIIYCKDCGTVPVPKEDLPVELPTDIIFDGKRNPLTTSNSFLQTSCPRCGNKARRETDTMDTFIDSSWYFFRFTDPKNKELPFDAEKVNQWLPVDEYIGGVEHAVLHLLYSRFVTKVLYDAGMVQVDEPFLSLLTQGMVLKDGYKMSKSKGNVVSPLEIVERYGADTARIFILFAAPPDRDLEWNEAGVEGSYRFLNRVWRLVIRNESLFKQDNNLTLGSEDENELRRILHLTIKKVTTELKERNHFNTAISAIMELTNGLYSYEEKRDYPIFREALEKLVILLAPFAPHVTEELWSSMGKKDSVHLEKWPSYDPKALVLDEVEVVIQINGKLKEKLFVPAGADREQVEKAVFSQRKVQKLVEGKAINKVIVVPGKLVNIVVQ